MGLVDFSPMFAPAPPSAGARGMSMVADALDAVMQARAQRDLRAAQQAQEDARLAEQARHDRALEADSAEQRKHQERIEGMAQKAQFRKAALEAANKGDAELAAALWAQAGGEEGAPAAPPAAPAAPAAAAAPAEEPSVLASRSPDMTAAQRGGVEPPPFAPSAAPVVAHPVASPPIAAPPILNPLQAVAEGVTRRKKAAEQDFVDWQKQMEPIAKSGPLARKAYDRVVAGAKAAGAYGKTALSEEFHKQLHELEALAVAKEVGHERAAAYVPTLKAGAQVGTDLRGLRQDFAQYEKESGLESIRKANVSIRNAEHAVASKNPLLERDSQVALGRFFREAMPTEGEMHMLYGDLGGKLNTLIPGLIEQLDRGGLPTTQLKIVKDAVGLLKEAQKQRIDQWHSGAVDGFGPGSGWENYGAAVDTRVARVGKSLGVDLPPVYGASPDSSPRVGSGNPLVKPARIAPQKRKSDDDLLREAGIR